MAKKDERKIRVWRIDKAFIITLSVVLIGLITWFFYVGSPKEIISVADQFKPGSEWKLTQNDVEPPRSFCVDVACPSLIRKWEANKALNKEEVQSLLQQSGWKLTLEEDCFKITADRPSPWCDIRGKASGYTISLDARSKRDAEDKSTLYLYIER